MYQEETLIIVSALSGVAAALMIHGLSAVLGRSLGFSDLIDRLGVAVSRDGIPSPVQGLTVLMVGGAALGLLYGSLVYALGLSTPRSVFGFSAFMGVLQGFFLVILLAQVEVKGRVRSRAKGGFIHPVVAEVGMHSCFGLLIGGVLSLLSHA